MDVSLVDNPVGASRRDELTRKVEQWVSQTFYGTLLKQMRSSPFKSELFEGGRGGEAFSSLFDQHLAERMARGAGGDLVRSIVRRIEGRGPAAPVSPGSNVSGAAQVDGLGDRSAGGREASEALSELNPYRNVRIHVAPGPRD